MITIGLLPDAEYELGRSVDRVQTNELQDTNQPRAVRSRIANTTRSGTVVTVSNQAWWFGS